MHDLVRASDLTEAMTNLKAMSDKLITAVEDVSNWKTSVDFAVSPADLDLKITAKKENGTGFIKTFPLQDVQYFSNDPDAMTDQLIEDIIDRLYKPMLRQMIQEPMKRSVKNICLMAQKK